MRKLIYVLIIATFTLISLTAWAMPVSEDFHEFEKIFNNWTFAFNQKNLTTACSLFSKSVIANYQGQPVKNYASICGGFKKIFDDQNQNYRYHFKLHNVYRSGNLAAVRITWYLQVFENGRLVSTTQDEGIDIFERSQLNKWEIINYIAYESKEKEVVT